LFGVDVDAFARTVFLSAETLDTEPGTIAQRLSETVSDAAGDVSADKAIDALDKAAKKIIQGRGKNGLYDQAVAAAADAENALRTAENEAKGLPALQEQAEEVDKTLAAARSRNLWRSYDAIRARGKAAEEELEKANARFANGVPDGAALSGTEQKIALLEKTAHDAEVGFATTARQTELAAKFAAKRPDDAALGDMETKAQAIRDALSVAMPVASPQNPAPAKAKTAGWATPLAALGGGLAFLAGLVLLIFSQTVPGAILLAAGVLALGVAAVFLFQGKVKALERSIAVADPGGAERARRAQLDADLAALLAPYGYSSTDGALAAYGDLKRDLAELAAAEEQKADAEKKCVAAKARLASLDGEIAAFFAGYGISTENGCRAAMNALREAIRDRGDAAKKIEEAKREAERFAADQGLTERPASSAEEVDPARIRELEREQTALAVRIRAVETAANSVPDLEDALAKAEEKVAELRLRYDRLVAAHDLLAQAQTNLVRRYVEPVKSSFIAYADALASFLGKSVSLDAEFNLSYEEGGAIRDARHLSAGERSVAALCLRMALADSLYEGKEQPPLILDDPLVHLDPDNLERAAALLRDVAKRRQILC
ncbi:MAG: hypothetical protein J6X72_05695, partial [Clostridia bacterium]|nr:hypothetical protein [Clostridia bacterium]